MENTMDFLLKNCKVYGSCTEREIHELEELADAKFDEFYRDFLIKTNGVFVNNTMQVYVEKLKQNIGIQVLYGVSSPVRENTIGFWLREMLGDIPDHSIIIGRDPGSNHFILHTEGDEKGIYYYDSSYFFEDPDAEEKDEVSTYFVCSSFEQFLEKLAEY